MVIHNELSLLKQRLSEKLIQLEKQIEELKTKIHAIETVEISLGEEFNLDERQGNILPVKEQSIIDFKYRDMTVPDACKIIINSGANRNWKVPSVIEELKKGGKILSKNAYSHIFTTLENLTKKGEIIKTKNKPKRWGPKPKQENALIPNQVTRAFS